MRIKAQQTMSNTMMSQFSGIPFAILGLRDPDLEVVCWKGPRNDPTREARAFPSPLPFGRSAAKRRASAAAAEACGSGLGTKTKIGDSTARPWIIPGHPSFTGVSLFETAQLWIHAPLRNSPSQIPQPLHQKPKPEPGLHGQQDRSLHVSLLNLRPSRVCS